MIIKVVEFYIKYIFKKINVKKLKKKLQENIAIKKTLVP